jgi:hypothetical protein
MSRAAARSVHNLGDQGDLNKFTHFFCNPLTKECVLMGRGGGLRIDDGRAREGGAHKRGHII